MTDPKDSRPNPKDTELDALLAGKHPLSDAYQQSNQEHPIDGPSAELDTRILAIAKEEIRADSSVADSKVVPLKQPRWYKPLAAAAMLVLCVGVIFRVSLDSEFGVERKEAAIFYEAEGDAAASGQSASGADSASLQRQQPKSEALYSLEETQPPAGNTAEPQEIAPPVSSRSKRESADFSEEKPATQQPQPAPAPSLVPIPADSPPVETRRAQPIPKAPPPPRAESLDQATGVSKQKNSTPFKRQLTEDASAGFSSAPAQTSGQYVAEPMRDEAFLQNQAKAPTPDDSISEDPRSNNRKKNIEQEMQGSTVWLDEIRAMIEAGDDKAATQALDDWRKAYPDLDLPEDIQRWAQELEHESEPSHSH